MKIQYKGRRWEWMIVSSDWMKAYINICKEYFKHKKNGIAFLVCTPIHSNLGDHAITLAALQLLERTLENTHIIEIPQPFIRRYTYMYRWITKGKLVFVCGGGYLGTMWPEDDRMVTDVIKYLNNCRLIILPQTIFYENPDSPLLLKNQNIYKRHRNLTLCVRDKQSIQWAKLLLRNKKRIILTPDLVTTLKGYDSLTEKRNGIIISLRNDVEKIFYDERYILDVIKNRNKNISVVSNISRIGKILPADRKKIIEKHLRKIASAEVVVTDRLHGMLFAAITGTPCVAFNNKSKKVQGGYEWIKNNKYIFLVNSKEEFKEAFLKALDIGKCRYDNDEAAREFEPLKVLIGKLMYTRGL